MLHNNTLEPTKVEGFRRISMFFSSPLSNKSQMLVNLPCKDYFRTYILNDFRHRFDLPVHIDLPGGHNMKTRKKLPEIDAELKVATLFLHCRSSSKVTVVGQSSRKMLRPRRDLGEDFHEK